MKSSQYRILSASNATSQTSGPIDVNQIVSASFVIANGDTTAAGTAKLQCSNQVPTTTRDNFVPTIWADIPNATSVIAAGVGPAIVIGAMCFSYIRVVFTSTVAGNTTITVDMNQISP